MSPGYDTIYIRIFYSFSCEYLSKIFTMLICTHTRAHTYIHTNYNNYRDYNFDNVGRDLYEFKNDLIAAIIARAT